MRRWVVCVRASGPGLIIPGRWAGGGGDVGEEDGEAVGASLERTRVVGPSPRGRQKKVGAVAFVEDEGYLGEEAESLGMVLRTIRLCRCGRLEEGSGRLSWS